MNKYYHFQKNTKYNNLLSEIVQISIASLEEMFIPNRNEFAMMKSLHNNSISIENSSSRYTLINLIGLFKAKNYGYHTNLDLNAILKFQIDKAESLSGIGDLGLLLWAVSLISPTNSTQLLTKINFNESLNNYKDAKLGYTMELSWFLTGLLFASTFNEKFKNSIDNLPNKVFKRIRKNYDGHGIFQHEDKNNIEGKLRANIGTFADQIYAIYALSLYSQQMHSEEALLIAKECAQKICEHQGENGEWQWQYNSENGEIINHFPIYSVHQIALAPMALFSIQMASETDFSASIFKSLNWLFDNPKLYNTIIDKNNNSVWNKVTPIKSNKLGSILNYFKINSFSKFKKLKVDFVSNSYDYGWILYTFAGRISFENKKDSENKVYNNLHVFELNQQNN
ncbi:MAG: hypothetical protein IPM32_17105 [Ignavibacteriae bacterium]|nr:hypothetical protein [Ignavibacteriota bacterium]